MIGINLLPWREERRQARGRRMMFLSFAIWIVCLVLLFAVFSFYKILQDNQTKRNQYLTMETGKLDSKINEIEKLKEKREDLISRIEVIQNLQRERIQVVYLFDDVVRNIPDGVYFDTMSKKDTLVSFTGTALSNARVSSLMDRLDSSNWFTNPDLSVINVTPAEGVRLSQFDLKVHHQSQKSTEIQSGDNEQ